MKFVIVFSITLVMLGYSSNAQDVKNDKFVGEILETNPEFDGGLEKFFDYVYEKCPKSSKYKGKVFVSFFVEPDGNVSEAKVIKGLHPDFDKMLLGAIGGMPKWKPSYLKGEAVRKKVVMNIDY